LRVKVERLEGSRVALQFEIEPERVDAAYKQVFKQLAREVRFPGFRKGKAPPQVILQRLGRDVVREQVQQILVPEAYRQALEDENLSPLEQPQFQDIKLEQGQPMTFRAEVLVKPPIELGEYKGVRVERPSPQVEESVIDEEIERLRRRAAEMVEVSDRPCQDGDLVDVEYQIYIDDKPFGGEQLKTMGLKIGEDWFTPSLDDHVRGMRVGEEKTVHAKYPDDYRQPALAGKEARFELRIKRIRAEQLPEVNDEFAKDVAGVDTVEELRQAIREREEAALRRLSQADLQELVVRKVVDQAQCEPPPSLVERELSQRREEVAEHLRRQRTELSAYLKDLGLTEEQWEQQLKEQAQLAVKRRLVLDEIAEKEGIEVTPEEVARVAAELMSQSGMTQAQMRQFLRENADEMARIYQSLRTSKTIQLLVDCAEIVEPGEAQEEQLPAPEEQQPVQPEQPPAPAEEDRPAGQGKTDSEQGEEQDQGGAPQPAPGAAPEDTAHAAPDSDAQHKGECDDAADSHCC